MTRFPTIAGAAALLLLPSASAIARNPAARAAQTVSVDYAAAKKKPVKKIAKKRKPKVEYMRAVPMK